MKIIIEYNSKVPGWAVKETVQLTKYSENNINIIWIDQETAENFQKILRKIGFKETRQGNNIFEYNWI